MNQTPEPGRDVRAASPRRPYVTPTLTVFGGVPELTGSLIMAGMKDGGPNNTRT